jgi:hypothetical protein
VVKHNVPVKGMRVSDRAREQAEADEAAARVRAERALSGIDPTPQQARPAEKTEPSLEQRLADIDRRARDRASEEKRSLATHYVTEARGKFRRAVSNTTDDAVRSAWEELQRLERLTAGAVGTESNGSEVHHVREEKTGRRERRSGEALRADAEKLVEYLKANPGSKSAAAMGGTGVSVRPPLNLRSFIQKYMPEAKVRTDGVKASTTYSIG